MFIESLERRRLLTGVTLITHGFGGSASDWVTAMANQIAIQSGTLSTQPRYLMTLQDIGHDGGPLTVTSTRLGAAPADWSSTEILVLLDWSDVAGSFPFGGYHRTTTDVGAAVAAKFLSAFSIPDLSQPLAELPIHMIGHSRGASLISEAAKTLGQRGVWVDQLTYLDPHPVDGIRDPFGIDFDDAAMKVYDNVQYAEDYWRSDGDSSFDFTGEAVTGAHNLRLDEATLAANNAGYSVEHSDTHLWYHGTIGTTTFSDSENGYTIGANWYDPAKSMGPRNSLGWKFSRIAKGARPIDGVKGMPNVWRDPLSLSVSGASVWDDITIDGLLADTTVAQGQNLPVSLRFEDRSVGGLRDSTITVGFDRDDNPYNGVFASPLQLTTSSLGSNAFTAQVPTANIAGGFRVFAKISNGVNTRYYYSPARALVTVPTYTKTWIGPATGGDWTAPSNWTPTGAPATSDRAAVYSSMISLPASNTLDALKLAAGAQLSLPTTGGAFVRVSDLVIESSRLDLANNALIVDYTGSSPLSSIKSYLAAGRGATGFGVATWNGATGITSSTAAASDGISFAIGYAENGFLPELGLPSYTSFFGQSVDSTALLVRYTKGADANLDGKVNTDEVTIVGALYNNAGSGEWYLGDFDYDELSDTDDVTVLGALYDPTTGLI